MVGVWRCVGEGDVFEEGSGLRMEMDLQQMHQIPFWLGLHCRPTEEAYSAPPDPIAGFKGLLLSEWRERKSRMMLLYISK